MVVDLAVPEGGDIGRSASKPNRAAGRLISGIRRSIAERKRATRALRRSHLDHATSVLLGLCYRIDIETNLYLRDGRRDVERLAQIHRQIQAEAEKLRKGLHR